MNLIRFSIITGGVTMNSPLSVGIDIGSTTIKAVVMDCEKNILYKT